MTKRIIGVGMFAALLVLFFVYDLLIVVPTITVEQINLIKPGAEPYSVKLYKTDTIQRRNVIAEYAVNENDLKKLTENNISLRVVRITLKCSNPSFFNTFEDVREVYANPEKLPPIVVGKTPCMPAFWVNIYSKTHKAQRIQFGIDVLIDPKEYNDAEILEMLKSVEVRFDGFGAGGKKELVTIPLKK